MNARIPLPVEAAWETSVLRIRDQGSILSPATTLSEGKSLSFSDLDAFSALPNLSEEAHKPNHLWRKFENPCFILFSLFEFCFLLHNTCFDRNELLSLQLQGRSVLQESVLCLRGFPYSRGR